MIKNYLTNGPITAALVANMIAKLSEKNGYRRAFGFPWTGKRRMKLMAKQ